MPLVTVELLPGRSDEVKDKIAKGIAKVVTEVGGASIDHCWVIFRETAANNWSIAGDMLNSSAFKDKLDAYKKRVK